VQRLEEEVRLAHFSINNMQDSVSNVVAEKKRTLEAEQVLWARERSLLERHVTSMSTLLSEQAERAGRRVGAANLGGGRITNAAWVSSSASKMIGVRSPPIEPHAVLLNAASAAAVQQRDPVVHVASAFVMNIRDFEAEERRFVPPPPLSHAADRHLEPLAPTAVDSEDDEYDGDGVDGRRASGRNDSSLGASTGPLTSTVVQKLAMQVNAIAIPPLQLSKVYPPSEERRLADPAQPPRQPPVDLAAITASTNTSLARARQVLALMSPAPPSDLASVSAAANV
jgi:hypothetical protein